jgi:hypothetical protein
MVAATGGNAVTDRTETTILADAEALLRKGQQALTTLESVSEFQGIPQAETAVDQVLDIVAEAQEILFELDDHVEVDAPDEEEDETSPSEVEESGHVALMEQRRAVEQQLRELEIRSNLAAASRLPPRLTPHGMATEDQTKFLDAATVAMEAHFLASPSAEMLIEMALANIHRRELKLVKALLKKAVELDPEGAGIRAEEIWRAVESNPEIRDRGRCFIATAACGADDHPDVACLRTFRDRVLLTTRWGHQWVNRYYRWSPEAASFLTRHPVAGTLTRHLLVRPAAATARWWMNRSRQC